LSVVLVGGSAATYYAPLAYQSFDADFVAQFAVDEQRTTLLVNTMKELGYELDGNIFVHQKGSPFTVEFPKGPLSVGGDYIQNYDTIQRASQKLHIISATDSVRDRLSHYYAWGERASLYAAVDVASAASTNFDLSIVEDWSKREGELGLFGDFVALLEAKQRDAV